MFKRTPLTDPGIQEAITAALLELKNHDPYSEEYSDTVDQIVKLHKLKTEDVKRRVSPDVWATVAANILGILIITQHENAHVVTSKALALIQKLR